MWKIIHLFVIFIIVACLLFAEMPVKDENFSKNGEFFVTCLNGEKKKGTGEEYYYVKDISKIYRYDSEKKESEIVFQTQDIDCFAVYGNYIYYNYPKESDKYQLDRYNMNTGEVECVLDENIINCKYFAIYNDYLYIMTEGYGTWGEKTYRCPVEGNPETDCEDLSELFPKGNASGEVLTVIQDGLLIESCYYDEEQLYCIQTIREQATNRLILGEGNSEVLVDGKRVNIRTDGKNHTMRFSYQVEGEQEMPISFLNQSRYDRSELYEQYMIQEGEDTIVGMLSVADDPRVSLDMIQGDIRRDLLFQLNIETGESKILYDTKNNLTRIIGYDEGGIYLFKDDYKVYSLSLADGTMKELLTLPAVRYITFDWQGEDLFVRYRNDRGSDYTIVNCRVKP